MVSELKIVSTTGILGVPDDHWIFYRMEETWNTGTAIIGAAHCPPRGRLLEAPQHAGDSLENIGDEGRYLH